MRPLSGIAGRKAVDSMKWVDRAAVLVLAVSFLGIGARTMDLNRSRQTVEEARERYMEMETSGFLKAGQETDGFAENASRSLSEEGESLSPPEAGASKAKIRSLASINKGIVAWLKVEGTPVDYPVVLGADNDYYLDHGYDGKKNVAGAIFMDYRNKAWATDRHVILYGHNMKNGTMFKGLMAFKDGTFYNENGTILLETSDGIEYWQVYSAYVTSTEFYYIQTAFGNEMDFKAFVRKTAEKTMHGPAGKGDDLNEIDRILTLSTCSYEFDNAKFVVHARPSEPSGGKNAR